MGWSALVGFSLLALSVPSELPPSLTQNLRLTFVCSQSTTGSAKSRSRRVIGAPGTGGERGADPPLQQVARERQTARDARQTALQELINGVRTVKLFGWSAAFRDRVEAKRRVELRWLVRDWFVRYAYTLLWALMSLLVPLLAFWSYVKLQGEELTVAVAFTALSLFSL